MTKLTTLAFQPKLSGSGMQRRLGGYQAHHQTPKSPKKFRFAPISPGNGELVDPPCFRGGNPRFPPIQPETGIGVPDGGGGPGISWSGPPRIRRANWPEHCGSYGASADSDVAQTRKSPTCRPRDRDSRSRPNRETGDFPIPDSGGVGNREFPPRFPAKSGIGGTGVQWGLPGLVVILGPWQFKKEGGGGQNLHLKDSRQHPAQGHPH